MTEKQSSAKRKTVGVHGKKKNMSRSTSKKESIKAEVKKNIEKAVEYIPTLIASDMIRGEEQAGPRATLPKQYHHQYGLQRILMWIGVGVIGSTVCIMWLLNTGSTISVVSKTKPQDQLLSQSRQKIDKLFAQIAPADAQNLQKQLEINFSQDKETLQAIVQGGIANLIEKNMISATPETPSKESSTQVSNTQE